MCFEYPYYTREDMREDIRSLLASWTPKGRHLYSAKALNPGYKTENSEAGAEFARQITQIKSSRSNGWAIPLHQMNRPKLSSHYVIWRPESGSIGWWDSSFGISGTIRFTDISEIEGTEIGHRLRFWTGEELTPQETSFDLPPDSIKPSHKLSSSQQNQFFTELTEFVREERRIEHQTNWEQYREWGLAESIKRNYATGPFVSLGQAQDKYGTKGFKYQLASEDMEESEEVDLTTDQGLFL
jgi:hypothetical protein